VVEDMRVCGSGTSQNDANHLEQLGRAKFILKQLLVVQMLA